MTDVSPSAGAEPSVRTWAGFAALCVGMFMAILDIQIVATSLPAMQAAIGIDPDQMVWIQTSYLIAEIVAIPLTGFLTRVFTMRGLFAVAIVLFTAASVGCGTSASFESLIAWRAAQGFSGGVMIPAVFAAVFQLFPGRGQAAATTLAGVLAVLAPTLGPILGGWITDGFGWRWLFFINVAPGVAALLVGWLLLPRQQPDFAHGRRLDIVALVLLALGLAMLELGLKAAPKSGWLAWDSLGRLAASAVLLAGFCMLSLRRSLPLVDLRILRDRNFAAGCALSFVTGMGLFGMVYLMPVHLAFVRGHSAFAIGQIMLVTGAAQLAAAPLVVWLETRASPVSLTMFGFVVFGAGLLWSAWGSPAVDFNEMIAPQMLRGFGVMFCLLPPTRIVLGWLPPDQTPNASGLFNLMRNLGGAIGLALVDTILFGRIMGHAEAIADQLRAGSRAMAAYVGGLPLERFTGKPFDAVDPDIEARVAPLVEKAAVAMAINEAWLMLGLVTLAGGAIALLVRAPASVPALNRG
jgi:MFS transporter, DHA2 family, multidrug resistance protein